MNQGRSLVGTQLGKYQIQTEIGRGGMSTVYKAFDPVLERHVALKVLAPHLAWEPVSVERFLREARAAARLEHPNIVHIYDVDQEAGWYYSVMEYLAGKTLTDLVQQQGPLAPSRTLSILRPLANALDFAHHNGLVHRDVKPSNVIVSRTGRVTLTDFGIARAVEEQGLTTPGLVLGTPEYLSPEQAQGLPADARSDQYSLAVVAYQMLASEVPFQARNTPALLVKITYHPSPPIRQKQPQLPKQVEYVLGKALAKTPDDRYPTATAFVKDVERALAGQKVKAPPPRPIAPRPEAPTVLSGAVAGRVTEPKPAEDPAVAAEQPKRDRTVQGWMWAVGALALLLLAVGLLMALRGTGGQTEPTPPVETTAVVVQRPTEEVPSPSPSPRPSSTLAQSTVENTASASTPPGASTALPTEPTAEPAPSSTRQATRLPTGTPTRVPVPSPTATTARTATATAAPQPTQKQSQPAATTRPTQVSQRFAAPVLLSPQDGEAFTERDTIILAWEPVGSLPQGVYYEVVVTYAPFRDPATRWQDDTPWTQESRWVLSEHNYLLDLSANGEFEWSVRVMQKTGETADGKPTGIELSPASRARTLIWKYGSGGGGPASRTPRP